MTAETLPEFGVRAYGPAPVSGVLREQPEDFEVTELLGFEPSDDGPHQLLCVEKRGLNTLDMIAQLATSAKLRIRDIGYCGLKDRHALTRQWLSVPVNAEHDPAGWSGAGWRVIDVRQNRRKLRLGAHRGNTFTLRLRDVHGDFDAFRDRVAQAAAHGVPNYFGPQRFGHAGDNLRKARRLFVDGVPLGRRQRRFALSAARSWLFNRVLSARVAAGNWNTLLPGEPVALDGSRSFFLRKDGDATAVAERMQSLDVHPSGPLWGAGDTPATDDCAALEEQALADLGWVREGLAGIGLKQERRALRLRVDGLDAQREDNTIVLQFALGRGAFATSVVHELVAVEGDKIPA